MGMSAARPSLVGPPAPTEVEVSLFGPGVGECVVIHLGLGEWLIVDSCLTAGREPVAISYLSELGVPLDSVRMCLFTHFHDDHIRVPGLSSRRVRTLRSGALLPSQPGSGLRSLR